MAEVLGFRVQGLGTPNSVRRTQANRVVEVRALKRRGSSSSSLISSVLHSHVNLECCDKIKISNLLLPQNRRGCLTVEEMQLTTVST